MALTVSDGVDAADAGARSVGAVADGSVGAPTVELSHVARSFGANPALTDLNLVVPAAKITVLLGPNGAGKTTAIRMITGALSPDAGTVRAFGLDPDGDGETVR